MDLHSHNPYWLLKHGIINSYPSLQKDIKTDCVVMGAGISGALLALELCNAGFDTVVTDRRHTATGSTAASTSLLQYEIDTPLHKLINMVGEKNAVRSYILCREAIDQLETICNDLPAKGLLIKRPSFQYASFKKDTASLQEEYLLRKKAGFELQWMDETAITNTFGFRKSGGLLSQAGAAADAYSITHHVLSGCIKKGMQVFDNTEITSIKHEKKKIVLQTDSGRKITCRKLFIACGYESQKYIPFRIQSLQSTFAIVSEPFDKKELWFKNALIWETATPYLYMRTTPDNRILIGGKDIDATNPLIRDKLLPAKTRALETAFKKLFPAIPFKTDFKWAGNFATTKDGLPFIGSIKQLPNTYFALGFGGNGITFSVIAARLLCDTLKGIKNADSAIFSFAR